jgi:CheY-like chemotaxis protein
VTNTDSEQALLDGVAILVVEDETIVSMLIEDMLSELGCKTIWQAGSIRDALALLKDHRPDAVVLDVNLSGQFAYPLATHLAEAQIPFVMATGYGRSGIPPEWASRPVIQKPFSSETLAAALRALLAGRAAKS